MRHFNTLCDGQGLILNNCAACPAGSYKVATGSGCAKCPAGSFSTGGTNKCTECKDVSALNPLSLEGTTQASHCRPVCVDGGKGLDPENREKCKTCPAGSYKASSGNGCKKCDPGTYKGVNDDACKKCPIGKPLSVAGATSETDCKDICPNTGQGLNPVTGVCENCPAGSFKGKTGTGCQLCEAGSYSAGGVDKCSPCTAPKMLSIPGATSADDCKVECNDAGKGLDLKNPNLCAFCPKGYKKHASGYGCKVCDPGSYSTGGTNTCTSCPPNKPLSLKGVTESNHCKSICVDEGKGLDPANADQCKICPAGHYESV